MRRVLSSIKPKAVVVEDQARLAQAQLNPSGQTVAASFQAPVIFRIAQDLTKMQVDTMKGFSTYIIRSLPNLARLSACRGG
jgi:hypothetical protein